VVNARVLPLLMDTRLEDYNDGVCADYCAVMLLAEALIRFGYLSLEEAAALVLELFCRFEDVLDRLRDGQQVASKPALDMVFTRLLKLSELTILLVRQIHTLTASHHFFKK
jgi:hypothetical protein